MYMYNYCVREQDLRGHLVEVVLEADVAPAARLDYNIYIYICTHKHIYIYIYMCCMYMYMYVYIYYYIE